MGSLRRFFSSCSVDASVPVQLYAGHKLREFLPGFSGVVAVGLDQIVRGSFCWMGYLLPSADQMQGLL